MNPSVPSSESKNKKPGLVMAIFGGVVLLGLIAWALVFFVFGSISLETYNKDNYSILAPQGYEKDESSLSVTFRKPNADSGEQSQVAVTTAPIEEALEQMERSQIIEIYDDAFDEEVLANSSLSSNNEIVDFKRDNLEHQGFEARKMTFNLEENGTKVGSGSVLLVFGDKSVFVVMVAAHADDPGLARSAEKILNSLEIKE